MKLAGYFTWLSIDFDSDGTAMSRFTHEPCRGIDHAGRSYRDKQVALDQAPADIFQAVGHFTEPNNIWTHAANDSVINLGQTRISAGTGALSNGCKLPSAVKNSAR